MQEFRRSDESSFLDAIIKEATGDWIEEEVKKVEKKEVPKKEVKEEIKK